MNEYKDLFEKFSKLGINEKRDAFSEEIMKISYILKNYLNKYNQDIIEEPYNYSKVKDENLTETDFFILETIQKVKENGFHCRSSLQI